MEELLPREKALAYGLNSLNDVELLALVIKSACVKKDVFILANEVIDLACGFENLLSLTYEELVTIKGIKNAKAMELLAILEIAKRLSKIDHVNEDSLSHPEKIVEYLRFHVGFSSLEEFFVIFLDGKGKVIKASSLFKGSKNEAAIGIDEILRQAILLKSTAIVVAHNHPSGDPDPSAADLDLTNKLTKAASLMGIKLLDHLIISKNAYYSFYAKKYFDNIK